MPTLATHPTAAALAAFTGGRLPPAEASEIETHLLGCTACTTAVGKVPADTLAKLARMAAGTTGPTLPPELTDHPRYKVLKQIGAGGMGVVYKAEHRVMDRPVALKVMAARYTSNAAAIERFRREVRAAASLTHPNIVTAHDADSAGGMHFLVMEFVPGLSLDRVLAKKGPLPVHVACQIIRQAAAGLQHAFEKGMVHRDIKPHNLMLTKAGQVKVLDFGLARLADTAAVNDEGTAAPAADMTSPSLVMGTPDYLAPEQARNSHAVDGRADIYALGCTFFALLTGKPPFAGESTAMEKMMAHAVTAAPDVRDRRPDVPAELAAVVRRMMAKDPADRFASPAEAAAAVLPFARPAPAAPEFEVVEDDEPLEAEVLAAETRPDATPVPMKRRRKKAKRRTPAWIVPAAAAAVVLVLAGAAWQALKPPATKAGGPGVPVAAAAAKGPAGTPAANLPAPAEPASKSVRVLFLIPNRDLWYSDYIDVKTELERNGATVTTAAVRREPCRLHKDSDRTGELPVPDATLHEVRPDNFDAVIVCGAGVDEFLGPGPAKMILQKAARTNKPVGGICVGQRVLVAAGLLAGRQASAGRYVVRADNVRYLDEPVVTSGNIVTAGSAEHAAEFARGVLAAVGRN